MKQAAPMFFLCILLDLITFSVALTKQSTKVVSRMRRSNIYQEIELDKSTGAACLDGSSFIVSYYPGNSNSWTFQFHSTGVGCYGFDTDSTKTNCEQRLPTEKGSSSNLTYSSCECHNYDENGVNQSCNCVGLLDCDGSFFAGYLEDPVVSPSGSKVYSRGRRNLNATLDILITQYGLAAADDIVFYGESGSGVGTLLALDAAASKVPDVPIVRGTVVGSYIVESDPAKEEGGYIDTVSKMFDFHEIGSQISSDCIASNADDPSKCMLAPYIVKHISTPLFVFHSKYDAYQLVNMLALDREAIYSGGEGLTTYKDEVLEYGDMWVEVTQLFLNLTSGVLSV